MKAKINNSKRDKAPHGGHYGRFEIEHGRAKYQYELHYPEGATDIRVAADAERMRAMAEEQPDKQSEMDALYKQVVEAGGLKAIIGDAAVHLERPGVCQLLVRYYVYKADRWFKLDYTAPSPSGLPSAGAVLADIQIRLSAGV